MQSSLFIVEPAQNISLVSLYEAKLALGLSTSTDEETNDKLELMIKWTSAEVAALCNRTFAQETVEETFIELDSSGANRLFLSHWPVTNIDSINDNGNILEEDVDYNLDANSGILTRLGGVWNQGAIVIYTGGYDLPNEAPIALQQATVLMVKEVYSSSTASSLASGGAAVRMVAHKESRIMYYDPNKASSSNSSSSGSPAKRAAADLLKHFMRFWV